MSNQPTDEQIGEAHFRAATYNRRHSHGFCPKWTSIDKDAQQSHIERGKIFLEQLAKLQQAQEKSA